MWDSFLRNGYARIGGVGKDVAISPNRRKKGKLAVSKAAVETLEQRLLLSSVTRHGERQRGN